MDKIDAFSDLKWLAAIVVIIWVVWAFTGGPSRYEATQGIFLKPPAPLSTGETYGQLPKIDLKIPDTLNVFLYGDKAVLGSKIDVRATNPQKEYFEIVGRSETPVNITGWRMVGKGGASATVGQGVRTLLSGQINQESDIYLSKGERAIIVSGNSPVGYSFKINSCSGYLAQFQDFIPRMSDTCPSLTNESLLKKYSLDSPCIEYASEIPLCTTPTKTLPTNLSASCREFILTRASHNSCVEDNKNNPDFYSNKWMVYLNKGSELWNPRDTVKFYDKDDNLIGIYTY
ncbi:MAG: hypothetical protein AAB428_03315 [Patescibacteria group bacterium]